LDITCVTFWAFLSLVSGVCLSIHMNNNKGQCCLKEFRCLPDDKDDACSPCCCGRLHDGLNIVQRFFRLINRVFDEPGPCVAVTAAVSGFIAMFVVLCYQAANIGAESDADPHLHSQNVIKANLRVAYFIIGWLPTLVAMLVAISYCANYAQATVNAIEQHSRATLPRESSIQEYRAGFPKFSISWTVWFYYFFVTVASWTLSYSVYLWTKKLTNSGPEWGMAISPAVMMLALVWALAHYNRQIDGAYSKEGNTRFADHSPNDQHVDYKLLLLREDKSSQSHLISFFGKSPTTGVLIGAFLSSIILPSLVELLLYLFGEKYS